MLSDLLNSDIYGVETWENILLGAPINIGIINIKVIWNIIDVEKGSLGECCRDDDKVLGIGFHCWAASNRTMVPLVPFKWATPCNPWNFTVCPGASSGRSILSTFKEVVELGGTIVSCVMVKLSIVWYSHYRYCGYCG